MKKLPPRKMKRLSPGATIGLVAPASITDSKSTTKAMSFLEGRGYKVQLIGANEDSVKRVRAADKVRAAHITEAFANPDIDAILCLRGGYGSGRIVEFIDYDIIHKNPKIFVGYSDITYLLFSLYYNAGLPTFHGPMGIDLSTTRDANSVDTFFSMLSSVLKSYALSTKDVNIIRSGKQEGSVFGGNLSILSSMAGTPELQVPEDSIVFFEDVNEFMYQMDRSLTHLERSGFFDNTAGIIIGKSPVKDPGEDNSLGLSFNEMIEDRFAKFRGPIISEFPCGHTTDQLMLPIGATASLAVLPDKVTINFDLPFEDRNPLGDITLNLKSIFNRKKSKSHSISPDKRKAMPR